MTSIIDKITEFIRDLLQGWIMTNLDTLFTDVNTKVGTIATNVGKTPQVWNPAVFNMVKGLAENVMVPIAGLVISYVLIYELITMVIDRNNFKNFDTGLLFKYLFKACIAVMLLSKTFDIVVAVFDVGNYIVTQAAAVITGSTSINVSTAIQNLFQTQFPTMSLGQLFALGMESMIVSLCMKIMSVLITVVIFGRMIEIYLYISVAPVPCATLGNREWQSVGTNYFKGLLALAFQGFFIMVCVGIYAALVSSVVVSTNLFSALWGVASYTVVLCFTLFKTGNMAKSVFSAH